MTRFPVLAVLLALLLSGPAFADDAPKLNGGDSPQWNGSDSPRWNVGFSQSTFGFSGTQMGAAFKGTIQKYAPDIRFDPAHPEKSAVTVEVDMTSIATGDKDRDKTAAGPDWFDLAHFPKAVFKSGTFRKTGDKSYEADGTLTIKSISLPVTLKFTVALTPANDPPSAHVKGNAVLDRSKFNLGTGEWADPSVIANQVTVDFDLVAYLAK